MKNTLSLKDRILEKEKEFHGKPDILGMTGLTDPGYINSSRSIMFTSHLTQMIDLNNPEFPKVFTNMENIVGKNSTGYYKAKRNLKVTHKIPKFGIGEFSNKIYVLVVYDKEADKYDIITKRVCEDLTEKFGYVYNTDVIDNLNVGDSIKKGDVLYRSLSYDDDMNYRYGRNVRVLYSEDTGTIEDAIICSHSFMEKMGCKEIETVKLSLNDNDILCNLYGDSDNYKCFPDIGEYVRGKIIAAKRRIHNNQLLFDLKKDNLNRINYNTDKILYTSGRVIDMNIFCNKPLDDIKDNIFNSQLKRYLQMQMYFYEKIYEACDWIVNHSGSEYTNNVTWYFKKAMDVLDPDTLWKEENYSAFSNMVLEFTVERNSPLTIGQKITGRQGNKGVISKVVPDNEMPYDEDGRPVDIMVNALGVIGRLNPMQIFEQSINFITNAVRDRLKILSSHKERESLLFDIVGRFNSNQAKDVKSYYNKLSEKGRDEFWNDIYTDGIYIHLVPLWEERPIFDVIRDIYSECDWIRPKQLYINKFGRKIAIMKPMIVSEIYMMRLKQDSKKGFSARSTGALNKKGVPDKSNQFKKREDLYSSTPIRIGEQENMGLMVGIDPHLVANLHLYYRSDADKRSYTVRKLIENATEPIDFIDEESIYNKNAAELDAYLKTMGYKIEFDEDMLEFEFDTSIKGEYIGDELVIGLESGLKKQRRLQEIVDRHKDGEVCVIGSVEEIDDIIMREYRDKYGDD